NYFFPSKNLGCYGDGGAICTNNDELADKMRMIANHGQKVRYYHEMVGCNSRLDSIQAAVLNIKLPKLDQYIEARRKAADYYDQAFAGNKKIATPYRDSNNKHVFHQYTLILEGINRDGLHQYLAEKQIPSMIYYPVPAHRQNMFAALGGNKFELAVTDWLTERVISLPMHTELDQEQLAYITAEVLAFADKN
ncbi:MAG: DegT/DnrJ/EryC1/StrS family aminotransferase, partial [Flavihumibacter sp.]|nr:DegT/DnrJ/EryC1/StrS family aminotransferase [Flavihumibacter sp.]